MDPNVMVNQILRLVRLDTTVFDEVRDRVSELVPALVVAAIASLLAGLGATLFWEFNFDIGPENPWLNMFILGGVFMAALYAVWVLVVYVMLAQVFKASADVQALFRTMGYAAWPLALSVLMFIPVLYPVFALGSIVLLFVMSIYAAQAVTNADSTQVVTANLAGLAVFTLVLSIIAFAGDATIIGAGIFAILYQIP
jgi:hypothetical protein